MIVRFFTGLVGAKLAVPAALASAAILGSLIFGLLLWSCSGDDDLQDQVEQTTASSNAATTSGEQAIEALEEFNDDSDNLDEAAQDAAEEIFDAQNTDDVFGAVVGSLCGRRGFSDDPSCQLQQVDPADDEGRD